MGRTGKNKLIIILSALLLCGSLAYGEIIERIVAVVGEEPILMSSLKKALTVKNDVELLRIPKEKQEKALNDLVERNLLEQKAKKLGISVPDKEVDEEVENVKRVNKITAEVLVEVLKREDITFEEYRETIRAQIIKAKVVNREVRSQIAVTDELLKQYYIKEIAGEKEMLVNFDVVTFYDDGKGRLNEDIKDYLKMAKDKKTLPDIQKRAEKDNHRTTFSSPRDVKLAGLSNELREAMKNMKENELGPLIRFNDGYQIFVFVGRGVKGMRPFEEIKEDLKRKYMKDKMDKAYDDWLEEVKKEIYVEKRL
jgi:peptidyl-prolyl cis-trans isomerase SurA